MPHLNTPWIVAREDGTMRCERCQTVTPWTAEGLRGVDAVIRRMRAFLKRHAKCPPA